MAPSSRRAQQALARTLAASLTAVGLTVAGVGATAAVAAEPVPVVQDDFEQSWSPWWALGGPSLALTSDDSHSGASSLLVSNRTQDWEGIGLASPGYLQPGETYAFSAWVRLPAGTDAGAAGGTPLYLTVQEDVPGAPTTWTLAAAVWASVWGWAELAGTYTVPADASQATLMVHADAAGPGHPSFLIDDVVITRTSGGTNPTDELPDLPAGFVPGGAVEPVSTPVYGPAGTGNVVSLTFDDGPNPATTPALLDFLAEKHIKATFCLIGQNVTQPGAAAVVRRIVAEGHALCNHSYTHADEAGWTAAQSQADQLATLAAIRDALGDPNAKVPFWRAPNGTWAASGTTAVRLGEQPLAVVNTIDDWETQDVATLTANLRAAMQPGQLVLVHDGGGDRNGSLAAVEAVVTERLAQGWTFALPQGVTPAPVGAPAWSTAKAYSAGDRVTFQGVAYQAKWWTKGETPGSAAPSATAWLEIGEPVVTASGAYAQWTSTGSYPQGAVVVRSGHLFTAKWWTQGERPGVAAVWTDLGAY